MALHTPPSKQHLRLYTTFDRKPDLCARTAKGGATGGGEADGWSGPVPSDTPAALERTSSPWGCLFALTAGSSARLSALAMVASHPDLEDGIAKAFLAHLSSRWAWWDRWVPGGLGRHYRAWVDGGLLGVAGLTDFAAARSRWVDGQIALGLAEGATQLVVLGAGYDTRAYRLALPGVRCFEVDDREAVGAKRKLLDAVLPSRALHPRPAFAVVDWGNLATLIPALTAAGFDPAARTVFVSEGLFWTLSVGEADALLSDVSLLSAPGSRVAFDFIHSSYVEGLRTSRAFSNFSSACANKGRPVRGGLRPELSAMARHLRSHRLRPAALLGPEDVASRIAAARADARTAAAGAGEGEGRGAAPAGARAAPAPPAETPSPAPAGVGCLPALCGGAAASPAFLGLVGAIKAHPRALARDLAADEAALAPLPPQEEDSLAGSCFVADLFGFLLGPRVPAARAASPEASRDGIPAASPESLAAEARSSPSPPDAVSSPTSTDLAFIASSVAYAAPYSSPYSIHAVSGSEAGGSPASAVEARSPYAPAAEASGGSVASVATTVGAREAQGSGAWDDSVDAALSRASSAGSSEIAGVLGRGEPSSP